MWSSKIGEITAPLAQRPYGKMAGGGGCFFLEAVPCSRCEAAENMSCVWETQIQLFKNSNI